MAVATSLVALCFVRSYEGVLSESFRERSVAYVSAFADAVAGWVASNQVQAARETARVLLLGTALYVQVVVREDVFVDERAERADGIDLPVLAEAPAARSARLVHLDRAGSYLDVVIPSGSAGAEAEPRYVRIGIDASSIIVRSRGMALLVGGMAALINLLVGGALALVVRRGWSAPGEVADRPERPPAGAVARWGGLCVDEATKKVKLFGEEVPLTPKQYSLVHLLASVPGRVFSDREIVEAIWPESPYADSKDVKQQIYLLRRRLVSVHPDGARLIANAPGFGYHLAPQGNDGDVTEP